MVESIDRWVVEARVKIVETGFIVELLAGEAIGDFILRASCKLPHQISIRQVVVARHNTAVFDDQLDGANVIGHHTEEASIADEAEQSPRAVDVFGDNRLN